MGSPVVKYGLSCCFGWAGIFDLWASSKLRCSKPAWLRWKLQSLMRKILSRESSKKYSSSSVVTIFPVSQHPQYNWPKHSVTATKPYLPSPPSNADSRSSASSLKPYSTVESGPKSTQSHAVFKGDCKWVNPPRFKKILFNLKTGIWSCKPKEVWGAAWDVCANWCLWAWIVFRVCCRVGRF